MAVFDTGSALYFDESAVVDLTPAARKSLGIKDGRTLEQLQQELQAQAQAAQAAQESIYRLIKNSDRKAGVFLSL